MRAFVTGGSGFVGRNLIAALRTEGDEVVALARSDEAARVVEGLGARPVRGDLDQAQALADGVRGCDVVFHAAAQVADGPSRAHFLAVNVDGTQRVLDAARTAGVPKVVHVSTEAVLVGERPLINADETWPRPSRHGGLYAETKALAEERVLAANHGALSTVVVRPRFIWGKGDTSVLPQFLSSVRKGEFRWIGGGRYLSSTCHVRNVCEGMMLAARKGRGGETYFLTDGEPVEFRSFLSAIFTTQGVPVPTGSLPRAIALAGAGAAEWAWRVFGLPGTPPATRLAIRLIGEEVTVSDAKARRELGYVGRVTREQGLSEMTPGVLPPAAPGP